MEYDVFNAFIFVLHTCMRTMFESRNESKIGFLYHSSNFLDFPAVLNLKKYVS